MVELKGMNNNKKKKIIFPNEQCVQIVIGFVINHPLMSYIPKCFTLLVHFK